MRARVATGELPSLPSPSLSIDSSRKQLLCLDVGRRSSGRRMAGNRVVGRCFCGSVSSAYHHVHLPLFTPEEPPSEPSRSEMELTRSYLMIFTPHSHQPPHGRARRAGG